MFIDQPKCNKNKMNRSNLYYLYVSNGSDRIKVNNMGIIITITVIPKWSIGT